MEVLPVNSSSDRMRFIKFEWDVYKNDPYWVPPLIGDMKKLLDPSIHPYHKHAESQMFLAIENGKITGRIAASVNRLHNEFHNEKAGFFGFFECMDSADTARALMGSARDWLKSKGMSVMRGPCNFSTNETCGTLIEGFDSPPVFMMTYNPRYYLRLFEQCGLQKAKDLYAFYVDKSIQPPEKMYRIVERVKTRENITVRHIEMDRFESELALIREIYNKAWSRNWGFVPMTEDEFMFAAHDLKKIVIPELLLIAEVSGRPAGFSLILPDLNIILKKLNGRLFPFGFLRILFGLKKIKALRLITLGIVQEYQKRGIDAVLYAETITTGLKMGYESAEMSWVLEDNEVMNRTILSLGSRLYKKYRIYECGL